MNKILMILSIPLLLIIFQLITNNYEMPIFLRRMILIFIIIYTLVILPYLASKKYVFNWKIFISLFLLIVVVNYLLIFYINEYFNAYSIESKSYQGLMQEIFYIEIPILIFMTMKNYKYTHYFFIFLVIQEIYNSLGKGKVGDFFFILNFGTMTYILTLMYYSVYVLTQNYFLIKHSLAIYFSLSLSMIILGLMSLDRYFFYYYLGEGLFIGGIILSIYSIFLLFKLENK